MPVTSGTLRISRDIKDAQADNDLSIAVNFRDSDVSQVRALIIGPADTPYQFGFFEFKVTFGKDYPSKPPSVAAITTNNGSTRFNPNIYSNGKVCLSILGTWRGEPDEGWSSAQGLSSVLWSIQSLMSANPYENEPGFETLSPADREKKEAVDYSAKVQHETLRITVIERLERYLEMHQPAPEIRQNKTHKWATDSDSEAEELIKEIEEWQPFIDLCKRRFLWYYDSYVACVAKARQVSGDRVRDGTNFKMTLFESPDNRMEGCYRYSELEKRLAAIQNALDEETANWEADGLRAFQRENPAAITFLNSFKHLQTKFKDQEASTEIELVNAQNPFVWRLTVFGKATTELQGGVFKIKLVFHKEFPSRWPRVTCETPLFHQRVGTRGTVCYVPANGDEIESHIQGVVDAIQDESPSYDPRTTVNPEASKLRWGTLEEKKQYNRRLRRSAEESVEYVLEADNDFDINIALIEIFPTTPVLEAPVKQMPEDN